MKITETETTLSVDTDTMRRVTVARHQADGEPTDLFLTIRALDGPRDQEHGSARLTAQQAEPIAHALLGIDDHHDLDAYASRVMAKHRRDCHDGRVDDACVACRTACGTQGWSLSDIEFLRARWGNVKPYDRGGLLSTHYRVEADGSITDNDPDRYTGWHVHTGGKSPSWTNEALGTIRVAAQRDDALDRARAAEARADRAEDRFAALLADAATLGVHLPAEPGSAHTRILEQNDEIKDLKANIAQAEAQLATLKVAARLAGVVMHSDWNTASPTENKPPAPHPEEAAVDAFKAAWHEADSEGDDGNRVRRGLRAALQSIEEASENE